MTVFTNTIFRSICFLAIILIVYSSIVFQKTVSPDAPFILGYLDKSPDVIAYLKDLFAFRTWDFQPIRDLTLVVDLWVFNHWNINTFTLQNILYWSLAIYSVDKLVKKVFPNSDDRLRLVMVLAFAVYPLFSTSVAWTMARKHILSFLFIIMATNAFLTYLSSSRRSSLVLTHLFFILSILSQPINLLWAVWASGITFFSSKRHFKSTLTLLVPMLLGIVVNKLYYSQSETFKSVFVLNLGTFQIGDVILAFGHYIFQVLLPYFMGFYYDLGHWSIWIGIIIFFISVYLYRGLKLSQRHLLEWLSFAILPLSIVLVSPKALSDSYLLTTALGVFLVLYKVVDERLPRAQYVMVPVLIFWSIHTNLQTKNWLNSYAFAENNYQARQNCSTATRLGRNSLIEKGKLDPEVRVYILQNQCFDVRSYHLLLDVISFHTHMLFFEDQGEPDKKLEILKGYERHGDYPKFIRAALLIKLGRFPEANETLEKIPKFEMENSYDPIIATTIGPYCQKTKNDKCLELIRPYLTKRNLPYL